ncbi:MAG: trypsin-like serine protease [Myxococcota bacterium]
MLHLLLFPLLPLVVPTTPGDVGMAEPDPTAIYGGEPAPACTWPTTVSLGSCTATLVHPRVIVYAAHCGGNFGSAFFGNDTGQSGRSVSTDFCRTYPGFGSLGNGNDWAFCVLNEEVTDVPIAPPLMGCETELLVPGAEVTMVGFGNNDDGGYGRKYHVQATLNEITNGNEANIGGNGTGVTICNGDSGGPAFIRLPESQGFDGSWRAFGIASWIYTPCGTEGFHTMMHTGMDWIESESGIDITPCHDADGTWNPGPDCGGFSMDPLKSQGAWDTCEFGAVSTWSSACGQSYPELTDSEPPTVRVSSHVDGDVEPPQGSLAEFVVTIDASDTDGSGIRDVQLLVGGNAVGSPDATPPYEFGLSLPEGMHTVGAIAVDHADNSAESEAVQIEVGAEPAPPPGEDDSGAGGADDGVGDGPADSGEDGADDGVAGGANAALPSGYGLDPATGCACTSSPRERGVGWLLTVFVAAAAGRRTRRRLIRS